MKNKRKKLFCLILVIALCLSAVPAHAASDTSTGVAVDPTKLVDRATVVQTLYEKEGQPAVVQMVVFDDAAGNTVTWAYGAGIVNGDGDGRFHGDRAVTRAELVTILYRYAKYKELDLSVVESINILSYNDALGMAEWCIPAFQWAVGEGIISDADGYLLPESAVTLAEFSTMLAELFVLTDHDGSAEAYIDEGVDTKIVVTGYTKYNGNLGYYFLSEGDKIAVISPSALPSKAQVDATIAGLKAWGFEPVEGAHVYGEVRTLAECIEDFTWALNDPEIKAIFCVRGGYGASEVMDAVSDSLIASAKKPIIGYSDITVYNSAWTSAGLPSLYACMSGTFTGLPDVCAEAELNMMKGEIPSYQCESDAFCQEGTAEGILIGGNLSTFTATIGTTYDCTNLNEPYILFFEEVGENMQHIHRYLTILKHAGILDHAAGILFGEWTELPADGSGNYGAARGGKFDSVEDMISKQFLDDIDVPVAFGFPTGHGDINYPLLMGAHAKLAVSKDSYTLSWTE